MERVGVLAEVRIAGELDKPFPLPLALYRSIALLTKNHCPWYIDRPKTRGYAGAHEVPPAILAVFAAKGHALRPGGRLAHRGSVLVAFAAGAAVLN
jgi:hypothetical protein